MLYYKKMDILRNLKNLIIVIGLVTFVFNQNVFAKETGAPRNQKIAVVGDSYAGHFSLNEGTDKYDYYIFPVATINNETNALVFETAINADNTYILFATGVNDQALNTDIAVFEAELRKYIEKICAKNKFLFLHTYMDYSNVKNARGKYYPQDYDNVYRRLAEQYENVVYIDMSGLNVVKYDFGDGMHFNKFFYDTLNAKLQFFIHSIERSVFKTNGTEIKKEQRMQIATAGDLAADEFFGYENKKEYIITNFADPGKTIKDNYEQVVRAIGFEAQSVLISCGIDDYKAQTDINDFMDEMRKCLNETCLKYKNVFLYSSLDYAQNEELTISMAEYDMAMYKVANEYPNTCYINLGNYTKEIPHIYDILYEVVSLMIKNIR